MDDEVLGEDYDFAAAGIDEKTRQEFEHRARAVLGKPLAECGRDDLQKLINDESYIVAKAMVEIAAIEGNQNRRERRRRS